MTEELNKAIDYLKDYIKRDRKMRGDEPDKWTDFDDYCETHCKMIEIVVNEIHKNDENNPIPPIYQPNSDEIRYSKS